MRRSRLILLAVLIATALSSSPGETQPNNVRQVAIGGFFVDSDVEDTCREARLEWDRDARVCRGIATRDFDAGLPLLEECGTGTGICEPFVLWRGRERNSVVLILPIVGADAEADAILLQAEEHLRQDFAKRFKVEPETSMVLDSEVGQCGSGHVLVVHVSSERELAEEYRPLGAEPAVPDVPAIGYVKVEAVLNIQHAKYPCGRCVSTGCGCKKACPA
jgi:hypothetical protein